MQNLNDDQLLRQYALMISKEAVELELLPEEFVLYAWDRMRNHLDGSREQPGDAEAAYSDTSDRFPPPVPPYVPSRDVRWEQHLDELAAFREQGDCLSRKEFDALVGLKSDPEPDWEDCCLITAYGKLASDQQWELGCCIGARNRYLYETEKAQHVLREIAPLASQAEKDLDGIVFSEVDHRVDDY